MDEEVSESDEEELFKAFVRQIDREEKKLAQTISNLETPTAREDSQGYKGSRDVAHECLETSRIEWKM